MGQAVLPRLLPKSALTISTSQAYPLSQSHVHRESCRPAICGYSRRLLPLQSHVFCPKKASQLPPHRPWDCAIDLLPGESVTKGKIYALSLPEQKAMEECIEEALQQGYICLSTSPAVSSFFFFCGQEGRRLAALYRLPVTEQYYSEILLSPSSYPCSPGTSLWCHYLHQAGPPQRVQPHPNT